MRDAARGLGVSEVARPAQVSGVLAAMLAARGSSMRSTRLASLITTSGWVWVVKVLKLAIRLFTSSATLSSSPEAVSMAAIPSSRLATQMVSAFS